MRPPLGLVTDDGALILMRCCTGPLSTTTTEGAEK